MSEVKSPEAILQDALVAEQAKTQNLANELAQEREARGKAEQSLLDANKIIDDLNNSANQAPTTKQHPTAKLGTGNSAVTYRIVVPQFHLDGHGKVKAADVKSNSAILEALVKAGSKVIEKVEPAK